MDWVLWGLDGVARETLLFAAVGFFIGGFDDLLVDLLWLLRWPFARRLVLTALPAPAPVPPLAVFVPTWREEAVIGAMLHAALSRLDYADYRIFVGCYPNDRATIAAVTDVAARDARVRLVIGEENGPTSKGANLNTMWRALRREDAASGIATAAVVLHDAEDVVHPHELALYAALLDRHDAVQIPVLPLIDRAAPLISGHYAEEFAEAHARVLPVRVAIGAGMPFAGVGCAIRTMALAEIAAEHGEPFDAGSLTEDYELGLRVSALGGRACFARVEAPDGGLIAVRAYFPSRLHDAVVQKARWLRGIALAGWDRVGWGRPLDLGEHWMRLRDRRAPLAVVVLAAAYLALLSWTVASAAHWLAGTSPLPQPAWLGSVLAINLALLLWRLACRIVFTAHAYGWREARWSALRLFVGNVVAILAVRRALDQYLRARRETQPHWDKTAHVFPTDLTAMDAQ